jgi:hypothetical protein
LAQRLSSESELGPTESSHKPHATPGAVTLPELNDLSEALLDPSLRLRVGEGQRLRRAGEVETGLAAAAVGDEDVRAVRHCSTM